MFSLSLSVSDNPYDEKKPGDGDENKLKEGSQRLAKLQKRREILKTRKPFPIYCCSMLAPNTSKDQIRMSRNNITIYIFTASD